MSRYGNCVFHFFWSAETRTQATVSPYLPGDKKKCLCGLKGLRRQKDSLSHRGGHAIQWCKPTNRGREETIVSYS